MGLFSRLSDKINGTTNQLLNEKNRATLSGDEQAIANLKEMDHQIGKLLKPFNGVARVPAEVVTRVEQLIKENSASITRVTATKAYEESRLERLGNAVRGDDGTKEQSIRWLEYENVFTSPTGGRIEQRVAQFRVGN